MAELIDPDGAGREPAGAGDSVGAADGAIDQGLAAGAADQGKDQGTPAGTGDSVGAADGAFDQGLAMEAASTEDPADPAAVRVTIARNSAAAGDASVTVGRSGARLRGVPDALGAPHGATVDGQRAAVRLERRDRARAVLVEGEGLHAWRTRVVFGPATGGHDGRVRREVVVDGWRFEVEIEQEQRARLRDRATAVGRGAASGGGRLEIRAMIPGKVVAVDVGPGEQVAAGQRLLVLEAMKMQNEVHAERAGTVERVDVVEGQTVELGDQLVAIT